MPDPSARAGAARRRLAPVLAAACAPVALAAAGTAAAAPTITADAVCLRPGQQPGGQLVSPPLTIGGTGFGPGALVQVTRGARTETTVAGPDGTIALRMSVLDLLIDRRPRSRPFTVAAVDAGGPAGVPPAQGASNVLRLRAAPLAFAVSPRRARPSSRVTFRFSGFRPGRVIWAHYRHRGRVRANVAMGRASRPCGVLNVRRRQIPVADPGTGRWQVQFDHRRTFSPGARPRLRGTVTVYRTFR